MVETADRRLEDILATSTAAAPPWVAVNKLRKGFEEARNLPVSYSNDYSKLELKRLFKYMDNFIESVDINPKTLDRDLLSYAINYPGDVGIDIATHNSVKYAMDSSVSKKLVDAIDNDFETFSRKLGKTLENIIALEEGVSGNTIENISYKGIQSGELGLFEDYHPSSATGRVVKDSAKSVMKNLDDLRIWIGKPDASFREVANMMKSGKFNNMPDYELKVFDIGEQLTGWIKEAKIETLSRKTFMPESITMNSLINGLMVLEEKHLKAADGVALQLGEDAFNPLKSNRYPDTLLLRLGLDKNSKTPFQDIYKSSVRFFEENTSKFIDRGDDLFQELVDISPEALSDMRQETLEFLNNEIGFDAQIKDPSRTLSPWKGNVFNLLDDVGVDVDGTELFPKFAETRYDIFQEIVPDFRKSYELKILEPEIQRWTPKQASGGYGHDAILKGLKGPSIGSKPDPDFLAESWSEISKKTADLGVKEHFEKIHGKKSAELAEKTIKSNPKFFSKVLNVLGKLDVGEEVIRRGLAKVGTKYAATAITGPLAVLLAAYETGVLMADVINASAKATDKDVSFWDNFGEVDDKYSITYKLTKPFYEAVFNGISNTKEQAYEDNQVESYSMETVGR